MTTTATKAKVTVESLTDDELWLELAGDETHIIAVQEKATGNRRVLPWREEYTNGWHTFADAAWECVGSVRVRHSTSGSDPRYFEADYLAYAAHGPLDENGCIEGFECEVDMMFSGIKDEDGDVYYP